MNRDCHEGLRLRRHFEKSLKLWGWFDAYERAVAIMPLEPQKIHEFQTQAKNAQSDLLNARHKYSEHMAECVVCSRRLVVPDAITSIQERFANDCA